LRDELKDKQEQFSLARADAATVQAYQVSQKKAVDSAKEEKNNLLTVTKGQESKYQTLLKQTQRNGGANQEQDIPTFGRRRIEL